MSPSDPGDHPTLCLDWGEGSGLEVWEVDCNTQIPAGGNNVDTEYLVSPLNIVV